jgi:hypothetical protein
MKLRGKEGIEMMDVRSITLDGEQLVVKGKMMGTMAATILVDPENLWDAFKLLPKGALWRLPGLLLKGRSRAAKREAKP